MTYKTVYWDAEAGLQRERDCTLDEVAEIEARKAAPPTAPASVTMRQARLALLGAGLLSAVETAINAMADPAKTAARIEWDYSNELLRANPLVTQLSAALGLTSEQVDALFVTAASL